MAASGNSAVEVLGNCLVLCFTITIICATVKIIVIIININAVIILSIVTITVGTAMVNLKPLSK
jgi:hypothetical protein